MRWLAILGVLAGCDRVFALTHVTIDPDAAGPDAATTCEHGAPFTTMDRVPGLADATLGEIDVYLSPSELRGFVTIGGPQQSSDLRYVDRADVASPFNLGSELTEVNARSTTVGSPTLSHDGFTLYYDAFYPSTTGFDIESAFSPAPGAAYASNMTVAELNATGGIYDYAPAINTKGDRIYWVSSRGGDYDVWSARWSGTAWTDVMPVYTAPMRYERYLVPSHDDLALYFGSSTTGIGGYELRVVTRADVTEPFGQPVLLTLPMAVTSATPSWVSEDYCRLYLASAGDLWLVTRAP